MLHNGESIHLWWACDIATDAGPQIAIPWTSTDDQRNAADSDEICYTQPFSIPRIYAKGIIVGAVIHGEGQVTGTPMEPLKDRKPPEKEIRIRHDWSLDNSPAQLLRAYWSPCEDEAACTSRKH